MKIFFTSLPFDEVNSGDYDYCATLASAISSVGENRGINADYVTSSMVPGYDSAIAKQLLDGIRDKNAGGQNFYKSLHTFYQAPERKTLAGKFFEYITSGTVRDSEHNVLNLQLRAPETGFLFAPEDLDYIKGQGFKVVITCHEYELNYSRQWLQTSCHPYLYRAHKVFFFSRQDMESASAHAMREVFLDTMFTLPTLPKSQTMLGAFSSKAHRSLVKGKKNESDDEAYLLTDQPLQSLECERLIGNIVFQKGSPVRCSFSGQVVNLRDSASLELEYGVRTCVKVPVQSKPFKVTGIVVNPKPSEELASVKDQTKGEFDFYHPAYDLAAKSSFTKVPPTTTEIDSFDPATSIGKKPNIIIFGLIRSGKGFEDAVSVIKRIHQSHKNNLPDTRLVIVGKSVDLDVLAKLLNEKFGFKDVIKAEGLGQLAALQADSAPEMVGAMIGTVRWHKLAQIKQAIVRTATYEEDIEYYILSQVMSKFRTHTKIELGKKSNLQLFVEGLNITIPEVLPIDFVLDAAKEDLPAIFSQAKYAIKYDEKGWANNASGLINLLSYGCILYTGYGMCTEDEVDSGGYKGALVLPKTRYGLKAGEVFTPKEEIDQRRKHYKGSDEKKLAIENKRDFVNENDIIADILAREKHQKGTLEEEYVCEVFNSSGDNHQTFAAAKALLVENFHSIKIASEMIGCFNELFD